MASSQNGAKAAMSIKKSSPFWSKSWLTLFFGFSLIAFFFQDQIQEHHLEKSLRFGYDPYGRNCILLTLNATTNSFKEIIPLGGFCLIASLSFSFFSFLKSKSFYFWWNTLWETIYTLPGFIIAISLTAFLPYTRLTFPLSAVFLLIPYLIRFYEGQVQSLMNKDYFGQSIALGARPFHLFRLHVLPELMDATKAIIPFLITRLLIIETSLTFIGTKQPSSVTSWGELLYTGKDYLLEAPWISLFAAIPMFITLFSLHLISKNEHS
jgi:ABC-type dipeptide/oligopeptide/nickel transport system permease subunit